MFASVVPPRSTTLIAGNHAQLRVLIVDDDALTRRLMSRMMVRLGCTASTAENGQVALNMLLASEDSAAAAGKGDGTAPRAGSGSDKPFDIVFLDNQVRSVFFEHRRLRSSGC
jgi:osomolarity two-component system sensor histidine kinase SLN1